ncbi:hypothetical protein [Pseudoteredinibacter isoporae]|uniref:Uncharacterized protein n=1 Tax=Pseudoteredinibacter isoporae TaxID=570281 RepID=A0A7X0JR34_9GAMM|nr:hypothetical protein [Pseudoteredinibacter isoporae]MBB6520734.1 hypothetical protein [Pseudoteredinibacter isoporae]NHO86301.1 hypothetical protein [Pseudoteredinibacter isoporae]NIB25248.1 hypothetical protein [Pseudoteredinibacter isoporae]
MNFFISVLSTLLLGLVVGFALSLQKAAPPTEFEKYSSANMDYATMSEVGYAMAAFGRKSTADYFELADYQAYEQMAAADLPEEQRQQTDAPLQLAASPAPAKSRTEDKPPAAPQNKPANKPRVKPTSSSKASNWPSSVVGIQRTTALMKADTVWQEFSNNKTLSNQLDSYTVSVFAIYSNFNSDFSQATISIGYDKSGMKGNSYPIPSGDITPLLKPSNYGNNDLFNAWQDIDYSRAVEAVVERRDYTQNSELTSLFVIYK